MRRALALLLAVASGCIPPDTTTERGALEVHVGGDENAQSGFLTDDGWTISFVAIRTLLDVGTLASCSAVLDETIRVSDLAKSGATFGDRGEDPSICGPLVVVLAASGPDLPDGVPSSLRAVGATIELVGHAEKDGARVPFDVTLDVTHGAPPDVVCGGPDDPVQVPSGTVDAVEVDFLAAEIFRASHDDESGPIVFSPIAAADVAGDGVDTRDLAEAPIASGPYVGNFPTRPATLADALSARVGRAFLYRKRSLCVGLYPVGALPDP